MRRSHDLFTRRWQAGRATGEQTMSMPRGIANYGFVLGGFVLRTLSRTFEAMGDASSDSGTRLEYHSIAMVFLLGALAVWLFALYRFFRRMTGGTTANKASQDARAFADEAPGAREGDTFDPDAALARYMARKASEPAPTPAPAAPAVRQPATFGRKIA